MRKFFFLMFAAFLMAAAIGASSFAQTTAIAVNLGGDLVGGNNNSSLDEGDQVVTDTGDFNNDTLTDARFRIPMDHAGNFINIGSPVTPGINTTWATGLEVINYNSTTPTGTVGAVFRLANSGTNDFLQAGSAPGTGTSLGFVFAPHVRKSNFLNGASTGTTVSFTDDPSGFFFDYNWQQGSPDGPGNGRQNRATVQNGSDWYISGTVGGPKDGDATFNPYTEMWYPWDVDTSLFFETPSSGGVLGSTFTDIQALGTVMMLDSTTTLSSNNAVVANVQGMSVSVDFTLPPPPTPPTGKPIVQWSMDSVDTGVRLVDPFSAGGENEFFWNGSAVPDDAPGASDPLFLGDPIQPPTMPDAFFDTANAPELTTGGQGVSGEALRFNGFEEDEAIGIVAWPGDTIDPFVTEDLDSVYVDFHFKEDDNTNGAVQVLVRGRSVFEIRINPNGELEWLTRNTDNTPDFITSEPLGAEGEWRHVQAWHDADGNKALYLDGELVGISSPGALLNDTNSITLGNRENDTQWFTGLIDEVYVGTGVNLPGDYNGDGTVDAADYTVWRDNLGGDARLFAFGSRDGSLSGPIGAGDYDFWKGRFGNTSAAATLEAAAPVPEPGTLGMIGLAWLAMYGYRRKHAV